MTTPPQESKPEGWYADPANPGVMRHWDGHRFTGAVAPIPQPPQQQQSVEVWKIALGVAAGIAAVIFVLFWFGGGFADDDACAPSSALCD